MESKSFSRPLSILIGTGLCLGLLSFGITRETPIGGLDSMVTMKENGLPLPEALVELRPVNLEKNVDAQWLPTDEKRQMYRVETDKNGKFRARDIQAGDYELSITSDAHEMRAHYIHISEGKPQKEDFELDPVDPYLNLYSSQHVFTPEEQIEFSMTGFGKGDDFKIEAFQLVPDHVLGYQSLYSALSPLSATNYSKQTLLPSAVGKRIQSQQPKIVSRDVEGIFNERLKLEKLQEGLYWVEANFGDIKRGTWFSVSKLALVSKESQGDLIVFATDLITGKSLEGVQIGYAEAGKFRSVATTGKDGLAKFHIDPAVKESGVLMGVKGSSRSFVDLRVSKGQSAQLKTFVYTDRPVYRPGDEVSYKGILRSLTGDNYSIPAGRQIEVEVRDADDTLLKKGVATVSANGTFTGSVTVNREAKPGTFQIQTTYGEDEGMASFEVAEYRKPEFSIKVEPLKPYYLRGEQAQLQVECEYFFGGPVQNAEVEAYITRSPTWDYGPLDEEYDDYYEGDEGSYGGEYVMSVTVKTDSSGRAVVTFPTAVEDDKQEPFETSDIVYSAQVSVTEGSGKYFDGEGSVKVVRSGVASRIDLDRYVVKAGEPFDATVFAYDPVSDDPIPNQDVFVEAGYNVWKGTTSEFIPFASKTVTTNAKGKVVMTITPNRGGQLEIHTTTRDSGGRSSLSTSYTWVDKRGDWYGDPPAIDSELNVRLDKKQYNPGETAKLIVETDRPGATALITVEADDIYFTETVDLKENVTILDLGVKPEYAPTAFVTVTFVKDKKYNTKQRRLAVDLAKKKLDVSIVSDKEAYKPGETANYTITTKTDSGQPVSADVSFGVVDESIYAIAEDQTDIVSEFYPKRYNSVDTRFSFEEIYLDGGDKAPKNIKIRKRFKDTAFWRPTVTTNANGVAKVQVPLPDNLTSWRATAVAITSDTRVGQSKENIKARKELMLRLEAPSFFIQKDAQRIAAMVTNDSGKDAYVSVELSAEHVKLIGDARQKTSIKNGQTATLEWQFEAVETGDAVFTGKAWIDDRINDGVELRVRVAPHGRLYQETKAGVVEGETQFSVNVRDNADLNTGRLRIVATPSLAASLTDSLDELIGFPYGCVEQTMSRFLPTVLVSRAVTQAGLPSPKQAAQMPQMVSEGLTRLRNMQHGDGSWGWWSYDTGDEFMTGYVLEGLYRANQAGFPPDEYMIRHAVEWSEGRLKTSVAELMEVVRRENKGRRAEFYEYEERQLIEARIQLVYGLALHKPSAVKEPSLTSLQPKKDSNASIGTMALIHSILGDGSGASRWLGRLRDASIESGGLVSWGESWGVEATARGLQAMMAIAPDDPVVPKIVRYLMLKRRGGMWWSTRDTSAALAGLTAYFVKTKELVTAGTMSVLVNGESLATIVVDPARLDQPDQIIEVPFSKMKKGENVITIRRPNATGYFTADMRQTVVQDDIGALNGFEGVKVTREYFRLGSTMLENGALTITPTERGIDSASEGEMIKVVITLTSDRPLQYLIVEDPIPSNCRINDRGPVDSEDEWSWWWAETVVRDDRAAFFMTDLMPGEHKLTYVMRAENPGLGHSLPTLVYNMYDPDKRASTVSSAFTVERK